MNPLKIDRPLSWLIALVLLTGVGATTRAREALNPRSPDPWRDWQHLRLQTEGGGLFGGQVVMALTRHEDRVELRTETVARFFGVRVGGSRTLSILDPDSGRSRSYVSTTKKRGRRYLFDDQGYGVEKRMADGKPDAPLDDWRLKVRRSFEYPVDAEGRTIPVYDYFAMLLQLGRAGLDDFGDEALLYVATSSGPVGYRVIVGERRSERRELLDPATGESRTLPIEAIRIRVVPADPERADEGFLDMEGEVEIWVEARSKTLLHLSGKVPKVPGRVRLTLSELGGLPAAP